LLPADRPLWEPLWLGYQEFYGVDLGQDVTAATWRRLLDPAEPIHGLGAFALAPPGKPGSPEGDRLVGIAHTVIHRSTWMIADTC
jgi:hypothetical protein